MRGPVQAASLANPGRVQGGKRPMSNESGTPISQSRQAVGAHLRRLRQLASLSLQDVASRISALGIPVSHSTISRIELGQNAVSADLLLALTETLGASFGEPDRESTSAGSTRRL